MHKLMKELIFTTILNSVINTEILNYKSSCNYKDFFVNKN